VSEQRPTREISVVLITDAAETIETVAEHLSAQSIHARVELVVATERPADPGLSALGGGRLAGVRVAEVDSITPMSEARAAGVRAATAPYVFLGETHTFAAPEMLERLLEAHREGRDRVAPVFENANPRNAVSWAGFLLDYGRYAGPAESGEARAPVYNCSYHRSVLLDLEPLGRLLEGGSTLNDDLRRAGCDPFRAGDAWLAHLNVATWSGLVRERYHVGRTVADRLSRRWARSRRVLYVAGSPLIPPLLAYRTLREPRVRAGVRSAPRGTLAAMLLALLVRGVGEAVGYAAGAGTSESRLEEIEIHKRRYA
jgi:hypothetical protein